MEYDPNEFIQYINFISINAYENKNRVSQPNPTSMKQFRICNR